MRSIILCNGVSFAGTDEIYTNAIQERLAALAGLDRTIYKKDDILADPEKFAETEFIFSTWGMPRFTHEEIRRCFPKVKCLFYAAGSVQGFAREFLECGIKVFSAWGANAVPVAEYCLAQILLANTGYFHTFTPASTGHYDDAWALRKHFPGNYGANVGIIGVGMIGELTIQLLKRFDLNILAYSRSLTEEKAARLGVKRSTIEEIFATCHVVSNHLANNVHTVGMLKKEHFASMLPYATFINTGRGAQVVESDLIEVLTQRPDLAAVLDVTHPEPPVDGSPLYSLPNCIITPHMAGSLGQEVQRMAVYMADECARYLSGEPCQWEVSLKMLESMA